MAKKNAESGTLLSDDSTIELVLKARAGDRFALEALLQRCLPSLRRWAHGRLPPVARGHIDTGDLVQEAAMNAIARLDTFEPRQVGALQAYLRTTVTNKIRDEMRRIGRRPAPAELTEGIASAGATPLEISIRNQAYRRYRAAVKRLRPKDRELVVARIEAQWTIQEVMQYFGFATTAAARMAVTRALKRLMKQLEPAAAAPRSRG
ncbi:MAG: RNA polymerase sigma factor [Bryobacteraceae bacterium]